MLNPLLFLVFAYILGSFPSGYLITKFSTGKDILSTGWRKTSASNVYRHIGKWQGVLTGILDMIKGYLAVYFAQKLGFPSEIQISSGLVAVIGHNWSCFLRMAGGRGIGTFVGALLALSSEIFIVSLIFFVVFSLIFNPALVTFLFLVINIFLSLYLSQFELIGYFTLFCLAPIFIKRLSPIKEIFPLVERKSLIKNRLLYDNDEIGRIRVRSLFEK